ncbi:MAG: isoaspartyl peptidase/L-asparaginase, partial [Chitinophagaceae bacterium]|nr:isoaspartyl peptidase/L-asparaginase [Chitinophagaceae bacterium]
MKNWIPFFMVMLFNSALAQQDSTRHPVKPVLVIHGGAGTILKKNMTPEKEKPYQDGLRDALDKGYAILK